MRSSKSRSRNKNNNRNRSGGGNVMNRVFDSNGPDGRVRGTPQQIIEKYTQLARDAALGTDRVAAESFQQYAEHYTRLLSAALQEAEARREQQEREHRERQQARNEQQQQHNSQRGGQDKPETPPAADLSQVDQPDVDQVPASADSGLVETPEEAPVKRRPTRSRKPKPKQEQELKPITPEDGADPAASETTDAAE